MDPKFVEMQFDEAIKKPGFFYEHMKIPHGALARRTTKDNSKTSGGLVAYFIKDEKCFYSWNPMIGEEIKMPMSRYSLCKSTVYGGD